MTLDATGLDDGDDVRLEVDGFARGGHTTGFNCKSLGVLPYGSCLVAEEGARSKWLGFGLRGNGWCRSGIGGSRTRGLRLRRWNATGDALLLDSVDAVLPVCLRKELEIELVAFAGLILYENGLSLVADETSNHGMTLGGVKGAERFLRKDGYSRKKEPRDCGEGGE